MLGLGGERWQRRPTRAVMPLRRCRAGCQAAAEVQGPLLCRLRCHLDCLCAAHGALAISSRCLRRAVQAAAWRRRRHAPLLRQPETGDAWHARRSHRRAEGVSAACCA